MTITYSNDISELTPEKLTGFFVGWQTHPSCEIHLEILKNSQIVWFALDNNKCVGFINALSDGIFYSFIPLLEVLPEYQDKGIGSELVNRMSKSLENMYSIDIVCDESMAPFYEKKSFQPCTAMVKRNYEKQEGQIYR